MNGGLQIVLESFLYWQEPGLAFWVMIYHGMAARDTDSGVRSVSRARDQSEELLRKLSSSQVAS